MAREYLLNMRRGEAFSTLPENEKDKLLFEARELLLDFYPERRLTDRVVALQAAYMLEGEEEEYAKLKRHGIESASTKGVSINFGEGAALVAPDVAAILGTTAAAGTGRLV